MTEPKNPQVVITNEVRLAFPALFHPKPRARGSEKMTYQATILLPPQTDLKPYTDAIRAAMLKKFDKEIKIPREKFPIKDAAEKAYQGFEPGWHFISLNADRRPQVVDRRNNPVTDPDLVYGGMWVKAYINAFAWDSPVGGRGVSFGLNAIQLVRDDERFDGRLRAEQAFEALELEDTTEEPPFEEAAPEQKPAPKPTAKPAAKPAGKPAPKADWNPFG